MSVRFSIFGTLDCMSWSSLFTNFKLHKLELLLTPVREQIGTIEAIELLIGFISGFASFGRSGKNRAFWTGLNRPVQNPSIVQSCPKLSKTFKQQYFIRLDQNLFRLFILFKEFIEVSILNQYSIALFNFQYLHSVEA